MAIEILLSVDNGWIKILKIFHECRYYTVAQYVDHTSCMARLNIF